MTNCARELSTVAAAAERISTSLDAPPAVSDPVAQAPSGPVGPHIR
ncbi:hypothetical protein AB0F25_35145 [Streptomyces wedmorensis]